MEEKKKDNKKKKVAEYKQIKFRMSDKDYEAFIKKVEKSNLSQQKYLYHSAMNIPIEEYVLETNMDFKNEFVNQIKRIGVNLNQIAYCCNRLEIPPNDLIEILKNLEELSKQHSAMLDCVLKLMVEVEFQINDIKSVKKGKEFKDDECEISKNIERIIQRSLPTNTLTDSPFEYLIDKVDIRELDKDMDDEDEEYENDDYDFLDD